MGPLDIDRYKEWYRSNPSAFVEGAHSFCKQASASKRVQDLGMEEEKSLWDEIKPWVYALGGGVLALRGGELWGRYAKDHGYDQSVFTGPFIALGNQLFPDGYKVKGTH